MITIFDQQIIRRDSIIEIRYFVTDDQVHPRTEYPPFLNVECKEDHDELIFIIDSPDHDKLQTFDGSPAVAACLPLAIATGRSITCLLPLDPIFVSGVKHAIDRIVSTPTTHNNLWTWHIQENKKDFKKIELFTPNIKTLKEYTWKDRVGVFYSGGIDAIYTTISVHELTDAIHISKNRNNEPLSNINLDLLNKIRPTLTVHKVQVPQYNFIQWYYLSHGCFLYSAGLLFSDILTSAFINGTEGIQGADSGSGAPIDHLFSTDNFRFFSYGHGRKIDKYKFILDNKHRDAILQYAQVCPHPDRNPDRRKPSYNCSVCAECLMNMMYLDILGARDKAKTFDYQKLFTRLYKDNGKQHPHYYEFFPEIAAGYRKLGNTKMSDLLELLYNRFVETCKDKYTQDVAKKDT